MAISIYSPIHIFSNICWRQPAVFVVVFPQPHWIWPMAAILAHMKCCPTVKRRAV